MVPDIQGMGFRPLNFLVIRDLCKKSVFPLMPVSIYIVIGSIKERGYFRVAFYKIVDKSQGFW